MLIKDLLVLFQAGNEGVCNILGKFITNRAELIVRALLRDVQIGRDRGFRHLQVLHQTD